MLAASRLRLERHEVLPALHVAVDLPLGEEERMVTVGQPGLHLIAIVSAAQHAALPAGDDLEGLDAIGAQLGDVAPRRAGAEGVGANRNG